MNHVEKFNETVGILVKAYLTDTLVHQSCAACAVGNLIAAKMGYQVSKSLAPGNVWPAQDGGYIDAEPWYDFMKGRMGTSAEMYTVAKWLDAIGYTVSQVDLIEAAFEGGDDRNRDQSDAKMLAGLMRVVDVLADIHGIDLTTAEAAKALFVKA